jgi:hypothetical protein
MKRKSDIVYDTSESRSLFQTHRTLDHRDCLILFVAAPEKYGYFAMQKKPSIWLCQAENQDSGNQFYSVNAVTPMRLSGIKNPLIVQGIDAGMRQAERRTVGELFRWERQAPR